MALSPLASFAVDLECSGHAMVPAERTALPNETSFLWSITSDKGAQSYLFGTFHETDSRIRSRWETLSVLLAQMKTYVSEADFGIESAREMANAASSPSVDLQGLIGADFFAAITDMLKLYGVPAPSVQTMKPWSVFLKLVQSPQGSASLDNILFSAAKGLRLKIIPFQSAKELVSSIEGLSADEQVQVLKETACNLENVRAQSSRLGSFYADDDVQGFIRETGRWASARPGLTQKFEKLLVDDRNVQMVEKLGPLLESGDAFVAVGASHLFGETGLVARLKQKGFRVEPLAQASQTQNLLKIANQSTDGVLGELARWLASAGFAVPADYTPPRLEVVPSNSINADGCEEPGECSISLEKEVMQISVDRYIDLKFKSARLKSELLSYLVRDVQNKTSTDNSCHQWQVRSVRGMILQSQFMVQNGLPVAGLRPLPKLHCVN